MFWDLLQQSQINSASRQADRAEHLAQRASDQAKRSIEKLEIKLESLTLTCRALFEILQDRGEVSEQQLAEKMREIDLRDGTVDGRITPHLAHCVECGRKNASDRSKCLYCGGNIA